MNAVTTRSEAKQIEYNDSYPRILPDGRRKVYEEVFIPSSGDYTRGDAENHLNKIHGEHDSEHGWVCDPNNEGGHEGIFEEKDRNGILLYFAWRHQARYK